MISVVILNGGSSSGKTSIAKSLQNMFPTPWLRFSIDDLIDAMPAAMLKQDGGIKIGNDGSVSPGTAFRTLESQWMHGIAEMARRGAQIIVDDVFLSGKIARNHWEIALEGLNVLWVGVFCEPAVASAREKKREDRIAGMALSQAARVHVDMSYDVRVDTTESSAEACARIIAQKMAHEHHETKAH